MSSDRTFVAACLAGDALITDIDDWVDAWPDANSAPDGYQQSLPEALGFTDDQYALWVERPESLRFILSAHRDGRGSSPLAVSGIPAVMAAAARASSDTEAASVLAWLEKTGRLG